MTPATRTLAWLRQFAKLWGFALFCILIVYIFREVVLPFLFAILVAYILAPVVERFGRLRLGGKPFPRAAAVIILYVNIIAILSLFIGYFATHMILVFATGAWNNVKSMITGNYRLGDHDGVGP